MRQAQIARRIDGHEVRTPEPGRDVTSALPPVRHPASPTQERIWLLVQLHGHGPAFTYSRLLRLGETLDRSRLDRAWQSLLQRHALLRSTVERTEAGLSILVHASLNAPVRIVELKAPSGEDPHRTFGGQAWQSAHRPFDLEQGPLVRCELYAAPGLGYALAIQAHSLVADQVSVDLLGRELSVLYADDAPADSPPQLPSASSYLEFSARAIEAVSQGVFRSQMERLKRELGSPLPVLEFPLDHPRRTLQCLIGERRVRTLVGATVAALEDFARREATTPSSVLLALFAVLLHRYTGQQQIVLGIQTRGRPAADTAPVVGPLSDYFVLQVDLPETLGFREAQRAISDSLQRQLQQGCVPFATILDELKPTRDLSVPPVFQATYAFEEISADALRSGELPFHAVEPRLVPSACDLQLTARRRGEEYVLCLDAAQDLFDPPTIERFLGNLGTLLDAALAKPDQPVHQLRILTEAEDRELTETWNQTNRDYPRDRCLHQLVEATVQRNPEATAVEFQDQRLTYAGLDARANQLASHLRSVGVGPDVIVPLCVERSLEMVIGVLGILKAGGAYLPLDPAHPADRLRFMIEDSGAKLVVTQLQHAELFADQATTILCLDQLDRQPVAPSAPPPRVGVGPDHLAYLIYTSGSTGRPKGVPVAHRSVVNILTAIQALLPLGGDDVVLAVSTLSFDIATAEVFLPLLAGGRLVIAGRDVVRDGLRLIQLLESSGATYLQATPVTWRLLLAAGWPGTPRLKMACTGEALPRELPGQLLPRGQCLWNLYGPTETAIWSTGGLVASDRDTITIGRPLANTRVYILDRHHQPVPVGVVGELWIGGDGVARGYLNRPQLTAERFIPDPFQCEPGSRLYRTGDLARFRPDGTIECLGRIDHQVKVRGFRIETGEIEAALAAHPAVVENAVTACDAAHGEKQLVAYVKARQPASASDLRNFLGGRLPDYMVPSAFVFLEALPLNSNGKVDRKALPPPDSWLPKIHVASTPPATPTQAGLARIWERILRLSAVDARASFFELGGDSLGAALVCLEVERQFGRTLPLATLFQAPTIEQLADMLDREVGSEKWSSLVPIQPRGSRPPLFLVHGVGGNVVGYEPLARRLGSDQPVYGLQSWGLGGRGEPHTRIEEMAAHYLTEMMAIQPTGPYCLGGMSFGGVVAYEMAQQLHARGQTVALLALLDTYYVGKLDILTPVQAWQRSIHLALRRVDIHTRALRQLSPIEMVTYMRDKGRVLAGRLRTRLRGASSRRIQAPRHGLGECLRVVREANMRALGLYRARVYPGPVTLFRAGSPPPDSSRWDLWTSWQHLVRGGLTVQWVSGNHVTMVLEPYVAELAAQLKAGLANATAKPHASHL